MRERYYDRLVAALARVPMTIVDSRIAPADAPVLDLRPPGAPSAGHSSSGLAAMLHIRSRHDQDDLGDDRHFHDHGHDHPDRAGVEPSRAGWLPAAPRFGLAAALLVGAALAASAVMVSAGEAIVVTQFGAVTRVITEPGLAWKAPAPMQTATPVDLRLRTTSTELQDVGTRDGLRILVQAYAAWSVAERRDGDPPVPARRPQRSGRSRAAIAHLRRLGAPGDGERFRSR